METKTIDIEILEMNQDFIKVKLPFLNIPIDMNYQFFNPRLENGYFNIKNFPKDQIAKGLKSNRPQIR